MRRLFISLLLLILPAFSQTKHPFTFEDMMKLKRVGEPVPSPDGKWVLFSAVDVDLASNKKTPHIWIVPLAGGKERMLIADQDGDRPRWAPDGKRFAFLSTKEGGSQVWIAEFDGAAGKVMLVHKLTLIATEASGELWSPDDGYVLFTSDVYPECDGKPLAEVECNARKLKEIGESKVNAMIFDRLLYRHWNAYKAGKRTHIFVVPVSRVVEVNGATASLTPPNELARDGSTPRDLTPGDYDSPVFSLGGQDNYAFSPDGQEICYTSNHDKVEATSTNNDLWIVPVNVGTGASPVQAKNITPDNPASDSTPLYSPDGKYIAYRAQQRPGYESDRFRLMLYDRKTGERKNLTESFDSWVGTYIWGPDSKRIFLAAEDAGESPIWWVDKDGNSAERNRVWKMVEWFNDDLAITRDGKSLLFTRMSVSRPNEIFRVEVSEQSLNHGTVGDVRNDHDYSHALTHVNDATFSDVAMAPLDPVRFWFPGAFRD